MDVANLSPVVARNGDGCSKKLSRFQESSCHRLPHLSCLFITAVDLGVATFLHRRSSTFNMGLQLLRAPRRPVELSCNISRAAVLAFPANGSNKNSLWVAAFLQLAPPPPRLSAVTREHFTTGERACGGCEQRGERLWRSKAATAGGERKRT